MGIVYLISVLLLFAGFIVIKKTEKILDVISFAGISIVVFFAYNSFVCYVMAFFGIPITLVSLSIINIIFAGIMIGIILKKKERQKYQLNKFSLFCIVVILIATIGISILNFKFPFNIKYESGDPAVHYMTSAEFVEEDSLLNLYKDEVHGTFEGRKIGSYVNSGIIMKACSSFMDSISYYNIFIGFGIFVLFLTGAIMYSTLEKYTKSIGGKILALIVSIIYVMAYPLNSLLFGFEYLSMGILVIGAILHMVYYYENEEFKFPFYVIIFALLNFDVFCSYYMFVPFTYSALWIYFCVHSKKNNKKIFCKKNITMLSVTLLIPFFLGFIYHLAPNIYNILHMDAYLALQGSLDFSSNILNSSFALYGYIYVNYYSNIIPLLPLIIYYIYRKIREKNIGSFDIIYFVFTILFIGVLLIGEHFERVSEYFLMKNYYALWIILIYMNFRALIYIYEKDIAKSCIMIGFYILLISLNLIFIEAPLEHGPGNPHESIANVTEIFGVNKTIIKDRFIDYTLDEIEILRYVKDNLDLNNDEIEFLADSEQVFWEYSMLKYINDDEFLHDPEYNGQNRLTLKSMTAYEKIGKVDYMVYFKESYYYPYVEYRIFENGEVIFENKAGGIIKYNID